MNRSDQHRLAGPLDKHKGLGNTSKMQVCPYCNTTNGQIYVGIIHVLCTNIACKNFDEKTYYEHKKLIDQQKKLDTPQEELDNWYNYNKLIVP